jgi:hypothetical protein
VFIQDRDNVEVRPIKPVVTAWNRTDEILLLLVRRPSRSVSQPSRRLFRLEHDERIDSDRAPRRHIAGGHATPLSTPATTIIVVGSDGPTPNKNVLRRPVATRLIARPASSPHPISAVPDASRVPADWRYSRPTRRESRSRASVARRHAPEGVKAEFRRLDVRVDDASGPR